MRQDTPRTSPDIRPGWSGPDRQEIALSFAHKVAILIGVVAVVTALWAGTSQPVSPDVTLGTPIVANQDAAFSQATANGLPE